jgi:hypothetical protein
MIVKESISRFWRSNVLLALMDTKSDFRVVVPIEKTSAKPARINLDVG